MKATQAAQEVTDQAVQELNSCNNENGGVDLAQFLANRIKGGHLTIDDVPESLKEQVQALLFRSKN